MKLAVRDLAFAYRGGTEPVIAGLTHDFTVGRTTAVTGPSGRGKSTLLYLLGLMLTPSSGSVLVDGEIASQWSDSARSALRGEHISVVFQDALLDPARSTLANVLEGAVYATPRPAATARARELLDRFGVGHRIDHRPGEVSGGQAQRVALCRALIKSPAVVLADEPTGNLDPASAAVVWQALSDAAHDDDATVVVASHDPAIVAACDEQVVLA